jgi:dimethylhistidine N-methyltransferase
MDSANKNVDLDLKEALEGLARPEKRLPSKLFYDKRGSLLFDEICELEEYYPTRTELGILEANLDEIVEEIHDDALLVEPGSGSSQKTRLLLDRLPRLAGYAPIEISEKYLARIVEDLRAAYPALPLFPVAADFTKPFRLPPAAERIDRRVVYFPGSTIGNFTDEDASRLLAGFADACGAEGGMIIGVDLEKDPDIVRRAYNDAEGVTAEFNLNILARLNRDYGADFDLDAFRHRADYLPELGRVEMRLVSLVDQSVSLAGEQIPFAEGETILTEYSNKYTLERFARLAADSFTIDKAWTDDREWFAVLALSTKR